MTHQNTGDSRLVRRGASSLRARRAGDRAHPMSGESNLVRETAEHRARAPEPRMDKIEAARARLNDPAHAIDDAFRIAMGILIDREFSGGPGGETGSEA